MVTISSQQGQIPDAKALAGGLSSLGTIAQPGSGSRTWGIGRGCLPTVSGGPARGLQPQRFGGVDGRPLADKLRSRSAGSGQDGNGPRRWNGMVA
jgi:hypothetical protein